MRRGNVLEQPNPQCLGAVMSYNLLRHTGGESMAVSNSSPSHSALYTHAYINCMFTGTHVYANASIYTRMPPKGAGCPSNLCFRLEPSDLRCPGGGKSLCFTGAQLESEELAFSAVILSLSS